ncbi:zinc finger CCHC domain-containing protein 2 [Elysia marginata]|uniref:Zinc finger CCHC domain-containing protein 2 n=1 Tax=Elysia marginata TaxID=1093978 RepID=A0AAV4GMD6_9GAST|nr:zinc finger CCHC domain-containing protein 2 [Elysia marginata]
MVKKDDLFDWFKNLQPRKRLDYMCALLHMCLPLELRFIGSVLEDLARKDFHLLRDAEIKANQRNDFSNNPTSIDDPNLRSKISIALALMNSTNSSCADIIFRILESQVDVLLQLLRNKDVAEQISLILTMAVYHPAFKFYQRNRLGEILQLVLDNMKDQFGAGHSRRFSVPTTLPSREAGRRDSWYRPSLACFSRPDNSGRRRFGTGTGIESRRGLLPKNEMRLPAIQESVCTVTTGSIDKRKSVDALDPDKKSVNDFSPDNASRPALIHVY